MLRLGTLTGFRTTEHRATRDISEGLFVVRLVFDQSRPVTRSWFDQATFGAFQMEIGRITNMTIRAYEGWIPFGSSLTDGMVSCKGSLKIERTDSENIWASGELEIQFEGKDAFIFCLSRNPDRGSVIYDTSYDCVWSIAKSDIEEFTRRVAIAVTSTLAQGKGVSNQTLEHSPSDMQEEFLSLAGDKPANRVVVANSFEVQYKEKSIDIPGAAETVLIEIKDRFNESAFTKPPKFQHEEEVRLEYWIGLPQGSYCFRIPNYYEAIYVSCDPILDLITIH